MKNLKCGPTNKVGVPPIRQDQEGTPSGSNRPKADRRTFVLVPGTQTPVNKAQVEEYLTVQELSQRIKYAPGSIRNLVWQGRLLEHVHYYKPCRGKVLFVWSAVELWLKGSMARG